MGSPQDLPKEGKAQKVTTPYPYVEITQVMNNQWLALLITDEHDRSMWGDPKTKYARTKERAEAKGRKMLDKWRRKYGDLADPYRIR